MVLNGAPRLRPETGGTLRPREDARAPPRQSPGRRPKDRDSEAQSGERGFPPGPREEPGPGGRDQPRGERPGASRPPKRERPPRSRPGPNEPRLCAERHDHRTGRPLAYGRFCKFENWPRNFV